MEEFRLIKPPPKRIQFRRRNKGNLKVNYAPTVLGISGSGESGEESGPHERDEEFPAEWKVR